MNSVRYIGMDVHRDTISVAVLDESGRLTMQKVLRRAFGPVRDDKMETTFEVAPDLAGQT